jgi:carbamoyltransferase|tara:strand:+ start:6983 stop:8821 length:1839 start_codon:yes stop_codon:yes gene_type:complete
MTAILGISAFYHDSSACIIIDGEIIAAAQEERFTRIKHDSRYPHNAIEFVIKYAKLEVNNIDFVVFYEKPFLKFRRLLKSYLACAPKGFISFNKSMSIWLKGKLFQKQLIFKHLNSLDSSFTNIDKIKFCEHHYSHAASAFYPSPFNKAIILTADGTGEWATTTIAIGEKNKLEIKKEIKFPHSLGLLYSAFTHFTGFKVNSGEYKLMGLAPYGNPIYEEKIINNLVDIKDDGSFKLDQSYFDYIAGNKMISNKFEKLFGHQRRDPNKEQISQFHMDVAASIQKVTEKIMLKICKSLKREFKLPNLCLAGGVALNCVANGKILKEKIFDNIWIQPAAGDAGGAIGAALGFWYDNLNKKRNVITSDAMKGSYLGPEYNQKFIEKELKKIGAVYEILDEDELLEKTVENLTNSSAVGWFQGRMEFGPRSLGCRSIIADPRSEDMQKNLNLKVKFRESFRPFAPSILEEDLKEWFELESKSPYMLLVSNVNKDKTISLNDNDKNFFGIDKLNLKRSEIPAVTHVDYSARIQTVNKNTNLKYYKLIKKFKDRTKCPVLVNTSFNVRGEPIVNTPADAFKCFMGTNLDALVIGNCFLIKNDQNKKLEKKYHKKFNLD